MPSSGPCMRSRGSARPWPRPGSVESSIRPSAAGTLASSPSLSGLGLFLVGLALVVAEMSAVSLALFLVGAVVAGSAFGALVIGSLSAANRLARPQTRAKVISTYFAFAYAGLSIPVVGVGVASDYVGSFRAVLGCSIVLAARCVFSAVPGAGAAALYLRNWGIRNVPRHVYLPRTRGVPMLRGRWHCHPGSRGSQ
jgi:MFS family permease